MEPSHDSPSHSSAAPSPPAEVVLQKDALRIQAAAVAAQQAALLDEETRLHQRRAALEQQEGQLSAHLEDKRLRLVELRNQCLGARTTLQDERTAHEQEVAQTRRELAAARADVVSTQRQAQTERRRLHQLRRRLKRRWHRHWADERAAMRQREDKLARQGQLLEEERRKLGRAKEALDLARLRCNGDSELGRRELQEGWRQLHREKQQWEEHRIREGGELQERAQQLDQRETAVLEAERRLAEEKQHWEARRQGLEKEVQGLETRIANYRSKLLDQIQPAAGLISTATPREGSTAIPWSSPPAAPEMAAEGHSTAETSWQERLAGLEVLAGELADQRLHLTEQCLRFLQAQRIWHQDKEEAVAELEVLARGLREREEALEAATKRGRQRHEEIVFLRRQLESRQAHWTAQASAWQGERTRCQGELKAREEVLERRLAMASALRRRSHHCQRQVQARLEAEQTSCAQLRQELTDLRQQWLHHQAALVEEQRGLTQRALALEEYRKKYVPEAGSAASAEKRLKRLRRSWADFAASADADLDRKRQALEAEATRLEEHYRQIHQWIEEVAGRETALADQQTTWEQECVRAQSAFAGLRQENHALQVQRASYQRQLVELKDEVERLARLLLEDGEPAILPFGQAA